MREFVHVVDTASGKLLDALEVSDGRWKTVANGIGDGEHSVIVRGSGLDGAYWRWLLRPQDRTVVVSYAEEGSSTMLARYAGRILSTDYDIASGTVTVRHEEIRGMMRKRLAFSVPGYAGGDFGVYDVDAFTVARQIILKAFTGGTDRWNVPVEPPNAAFSGSYRLTWPRWQFTTTEEMLSTIQDQPDGPDIHFLPHWRDDAIFWEARIGRPRLQAPTWEISLDAGDRDATGVRYREDGARIVTGVHMLGEGSEDAMLRGSAVAGTGSFLYADDVIDDKNCSIQQALDGGAKSWLDAHSAPTRQWDWQMRLDGAPSILDLVPGSRIRAWRSGDEWIEEGWSELYVIGMSVQGGEMTVETQPI